MFIRRGLVCLLVTGTTNAWPAETTTPLNTNVIEDIVVTASRIERPDFSYSNPVFSVTGDDIRASGVKDMSYFLKQIPALSGSINSHDTAGGDMYGTNGLTALDLRNLGRTRTLVLVNGRRYVGSPFPTGSVVDIDSLPLNLVERVEVMTGGASALYGADGVSGVVNFVMKDRYEGLEISAQTGASSKHDAQSRSTSVTYGTPLANDRGHLSVSLDYVKDEHLARQRRSFSSPAGFTQFVLNPDNPGADSNLPDQVPLRDIRYVDYSRNGAVDVTLDGLPEFDGDGTPWDPGRFIESSFQQGGSGSEPAGFLPDTLPEKESYSFTALFDFDLGEDLGLFSEFSYNKRDSLGEFVPTYDSYLVFFPDGPFIPSAVTAAAAGSPVLLTRDNFDLGVQVDDTQRETYRGVIGLEGAFSDSLEFEVSYTYGETAVESLYINNRYNDRYAAALDAVVDPGTGEVVCASELDPTAEPANLQFQGWNRYTPLPGTWAGSFMPGAGDCVPINMFGEGSPSQAAINWVMTDSRATANMQQHVAQAYLRGDSSEWLVSPAGAVGFVLGAEWRKEKVSTNPPDEDRLGLTYGNKFPGERVERDVTEVFAEVDVPLLAQAKFAEYLALDAAVRYSDYSTIGSTTTWKTGLVWQPFNSLTLRATIAEATRAPSLQELQDGSGQTFENISDPCDINNLVNGTEFRVTNCAQLLTSLGVDPTTFITPSSDSVSGLISGNPELFQETADTKTWGFIYTPEFVEGLTISADWYDIDLQDAIALASPEDAAKLCVDLPEFGNEFCDLIGRGSDGGISEFTQQPKNVASFTTRGVDFNVFYVLDLGRWGLTQRWGSMHMQLTGNKLQELKTVSLPGTAPVSGLGQRYRPEWQGNFDLQWLLANTLLRWQVHYFDETNRFDDLTTQNNPNIVARKYLQFDRKLTHDVYASHQFTDQLTVFAGVNNLTNEKPDVGEVFYPVSAVGRYLYAGLRLSL